MTIWTDNMRGTGRGNYFTAFGVLDMAFPASFLKKVRVNFGYRFYLFIHYAKQPSGKTFG